MRFHTSLRGALASGLVLSSAAFAAAQQQPANDAAPPREQTPRTERRTEDRTGTADEVRGNQSDESRLTDYFADQLMLANQSEIELSQIAAQKSTNQEVKQFAEKLIQEHQQLDEKLKQLAPEAAARFADRPRAGGRLADRLTDRLDAERSADRPASDRPANDRPAQIRTAARDAAAHDALTKLCMINHKACENHRQMSKQMLESYQGQDFDMAFLGMQIGQHAWLLSELKALDGVGTPEFQELVVQARQNVEQHLQHAKTLSKKFEDDRRAPRDS
jgi:predicted outer membrane protein